MFGSNNIDIYSQEFSRDPMIPIYSARPDQVKKALKYVCYAAANQLEGKYFELLIAILPDHNGSLYGKQISIKVLCNLNMITTSTSGFSLVSNGLSQ